MMSGTKLALLSDILNALKTDVQVRISPSPQSAFGGRLVLLEGDVLQLIYKNSDAEGVREQRLLFCVPVELIDMFFLCSFFS